MRRVFRAGRLVSAMATLAVACVVFATSAGAAKVQAAKPTLTLGGDTFCLSTLPLPAGARAWEITFMNVAYEGLIRFDSRARYVPGLATSWRVHRGNKVMTLTLRRNARFSDGTPVDARAVKTSIEAGLTSGGVGRITLGPVRSVEALSRYVVRVTLRTPHPDFVYAMSSRAGFSGGGLPVNPKAIAQAKANPNNPAWAKATFGAGPYVLVPGESAIGDRCVYAPNKFYYDKSRQKWGKLVFKKVVDPNAILAATRTGELDVAKGNVAFADAARAAGVRVFTTPADLYNGITVIDPGGKIVPALTDVRVRQALNYAVNRRSMATALFGRYAVPTSSPWTTQEGNLARFNNHYPYNPARARQLLAAAGYPNGFSVRLFTVGTWFPGYRTEEQAQAAVRDFAAVGIRVDVDSPATSAAWFAAFPSKRYGLYTGPAGGYRDVLASFQLGFRSFLWPDGFTDPVIDRLYLRGIRAAPRARESIKRQMIERAIVQAYYVPFFMTPNVTYVGKRVKNFRRAHELALDPMEMSP